MVLGNEKQIKIGKYIKLQKVRDIYIRATQREVEQRVLQIIYYRVYREVEQRVLHTNDGIEYNKSIIESNSNRREMIERMRKYIQNYKTN